MKKQWLTNLVLLCITIALASVIYFSDEQHNEKQLDTLTAVDSHTIKSIRIEHNGHITRLEKQAGEWRITEPVDIAANNFRIKTILQLLNAPVHRQYPLKALDADKIGLQGNDSRRETRVAFDHIELVFGIINPATNLRYVKRGSTVYTIEDVYHPLITSHFGSLVSLNLLPSGSILKKLELPNQTISKDSNGNWSSTPDADGDRIMETVDHWQSAQAFGIHAYMQRQQLGKITAHLLNKPPIHFMITDTDPWLILARPELGLEYHLEREAYDQLIAPR